MIARHASVRGGIRPLAKRVYLVRWKHWPADEFGPDLYLDAKDAWADYTKTFAYPGEAPWETKSRLTQEGLRVVECVAEQIRVSPPISRIPA